jgi:hypothetical protein
MALIVDPRRDNQLNQEIPFVTCECVVFFTKFRDKKFSCHFATCELRNFAGWKNEIS